MKQDQQIDWTAYYHARRGRPPRPLLLDVMTRFGSNVSGRGLLAIDLGCGEGSDTLALLQSGWRVLAIDQQPEALALLQEQVEEGLQSQLQTMVASFEALTLPPANLIYASYSLPFCQPAHFATLWQQIEANLCQGGRFAGQLFGDRDEWAERDSMTFLSKADAQALFTRFDVELFHEVDEDGKAVSGPKHWHYFDVIARKE